MAAKSQRFSMKYSVDTSLPYSAEEFLPNYIVDIPLKGLGGEIMSLNAVEDKIRIAKDMVQGGFSIKVNKQRVHDTRDFDRTEFVNYGHLRTSYPIVEVNELTGWLNLQKQVTYPNDWVSVRRKTTQYERNLYIIPGGSANGIVGNADYTVTYTGSMLGLGLSNADYIPNYWRVDYISGYDIIPNDLLMIIGKIASMQVLAILGDITFGAGIANFSLSLDGISQSIGTTSSAENSLYSARIKQYQTELKEELPAVQSRYKGLMFTVA